MSGRSAEPLRTAQRRLRGVSRAGMPVPASILCFQQVYATATSVTPAGTEYAPFCPERLHSAHVDLRKHGNASVYAVSGSMALIPQAFPQSYRTVTLQLPSGGDVSPTAAGAVGTVTRLARTTLLEDTPDAARRLLGNRYAYPPKRKTRLGWTPSWC